MTHTKHAAFYLSAYMLIVIMLSGCSSAPKPAECNGSFMPINTTKSKVAKTKENQQLSQIQVRCIVEKHHG